MTENRESHVKDSPNLAYSKLSCSWKSSLSSKWPGREVEKVREMHT